MITYFDFFILERYLHNPFFYFPVGNIDNRLWNNESIKGCSIHFFMFI